MSLGVYFAGLGAVYLLRVGIAALWRPAISFRYPYILNIYSTTNCGRRDEIIRNGALNYAFHTAAHLWTRFIKPRGVTIFIALNLVAAAYNTVLLISRISLSKNINQTTPIQDDTRESYYLRMLLGMMQNIAKK